MYTRYSHKVINFIDFFFWKLPTVLISPDRTKHISTFLEVKKNGIYKIIKTIKKDLKVINVQYGIYYYFYHRYIPQYKPSIIRLVAVRET